MMESRETSRDVTPEGRDRVADALCRHFAAGHLELEELESRLEGVDRAGTVEELDRLLGDLPAPPARRDAWTPAPAPKPRGWALALLGGHGRKGRWVPPRSLRAVAVMGGVDLDFRDARLGPGVTRVTAVALMGGIDIVVPPGLPVEVRGLGVLGSVEQGEAGGEAPEAAGAPRLEVVALACMGGVDVRTRAREGEEKSDAAP